MGFIGCLLGTHYYAYKNGLYSTVCILSIFYCSSTIIPQPLHQLQSLHEWCVSTKGALEKALLKHNPWVWQFLTFRGELKLEKVGVWVRRYLSGVHYTPSTDSQNLCILMPGLKPSHVGPLQIITLYASPITPCVK